MTEESGARIVLVGHCRPDQFMLKSAVESMLPGAEVAVANDHGSLDSAETSAVYLVNRVLDGDFPSTDGIALIERLASDGARAMLISNLPDAHANSESRGGVPGFGKNELRSDRMRTAIESALSAV